ncbi:MAG: helix-turn-helix domain-containing protein [Flavobacteriales bacterium]
MEQHRITALRASGGPGQVHRLVRSADMNGFVAVMFAPDAQLGQGHGARIALFANAEGNCTFQLDDAQLRECTALVEMMERELATKPLAEVVEGPRGATDQMRALGKGRVGGGRPDRSGPRKRFLEMLEAGYLEDRQVMHYAERLAMSADHLNEQVKKRLGRTASSVIQDRLLLEAKRLLLHADLSVKEVGYALNLKDPAYFTRWFHKAAGVPPATYRDEIRKSGKH